MSKGSWFLLFLILGTVILSPVASINQVSQPENSSSKISLSPDTSRSLPVGILVMQSGFVSDIGTEYSRAFKMAEQDNPHSCIRQVIMDGGSERNVAVESWQKMKNTSPDIPIVLTVASWTSNVVYPDTADSGTIQFALGSAALNRSKSDDHLIWFTPGVRQESPVLASFLDQFSRITIIGGNNDYSRGYSAAIDALLPGTVIHTIQYDQNTVNTTLNVSEIKEGDPDVILLLSFSEGPAVMELLRDEGVTTPFVGTRGIESNALVKTKAAEGLIFTTPELNQSHPFFARYREMYGDNATFYGAEGFDALTTLYAAADTCGDAPECVYSWYQNRTYNGALGQVSFDDNGVATYPITFKIVRNGRFEDYLDTAEGERS